MRKMMLILVVTGIALLLVVWGVKSTHWWIRIDKANVFIDGRLAEASRAYRSKEGDILIYLPQADPWGRMYVVRNSSREVGLPVSSSEFSLLPNGIVGYVYSRHFPPHLVYMKTGKLDADPKLTISTSYVEFNDIDNKVLKVLW